MRIIGMIGGMSRESTAIYYRAINNKDARGAEGVILILGCTEIGMLLDSRHVSLPLFDTARLHAMAAVAEAVRN